jgi:prolyl 4-hydroxylase
MRPDLIDTPELRQWIVQQTAAGQAPDRLLKELTDRGLDAEQAVDIMTAALEARLAAARAANTSDAADSPAVLHVPQPFGHDWPAVIRAEDRDVRVLFSLAQPRVVLFGGLLADAECDEIVVQAKRHLSASNVIDMEHGGEQLHADRTSSGMAFARGATPVVARIERRIAALLKWPLCNGEALQILRYEAGQQYKPHYDYVDPSQPGPLPRSWRAARRLARHVPQHAGGRRRDQFPGHRARGRGGQRERAVLQL